MKKLLALVLVLGISTFAHAAFVITGPAELNPGQIGSYTVALDGPAGISIMDIDYSVTRGAIQNSLVATFANRDATADLTVGNGKAMPNSISFAANSGFELPLGATLFTFELAAPAELGVSQIVMAVGEANGGAYDLNFEQVPVGSVTGAFNVNIVPEPMTMSLLALGGLVALRRRG